LEDHTSQEYVFLLIFLRVDLALTDLLPLNSIT